MLGVCTARRMLLSIKSAGGQKANAGMKDYDRSRIEKIEPRRAAGAAFGREQENERLGLSCKKMNEKLADRAIG